ncbi:MAG TPA: hypothetical protein VGY76_07025 [Solirubrobacteraceae bacterium]|nr:hypothetical protein [Solirubrobacteraceae bacterium]
MSTTKTLFMAIAATLLFGLLTAPAFGDFVGKEGTSKGENIEFTFGEVVVKCAKDTDKYIMREDFEAQNPAKKGHIDATIFFEECQANQGIGHVEDFECGIEFKPIGRAKFKSACTINLLCCLVQIEGPPLNQDLGKLIYKNVPPNSVEINAELSGITYKTEGPCEGIKIAKKASNGTYKDPQTEEGSELNGIQCNSITGSGSVLQTALQTIFTKEVKTECEEPPAVEYKATSNEQALKEWGSEKGELNAKESGNGVKLDKYIASDLAPEEMQIKMMDKAAKATSGLTNSVVTTPVAQSAVAVLVSLPVACSATMTAPNVEDLALEEEWSANKGTLEALIKNAGIMSCGTKEAPKLIVRKDSASATAGFKRFMNEINKTTWAKFVKTGKLAANNEWPATVEKTGEGGEGEAKTVYNTPNSMGYADLADAKTVGFTSLPTHHKNGKEEYYSFFVEVQNSNKGTVKFASPEAGSGASNCEATTYTEPEGGVAPDVDWSLASESNGLAGTTYPICTLTFDLAWQHYSYLGSEIFLQEQYADTVQSYLMWLLIKGQNEKALKSDHFAPLPSETISKAAKGVKLYVGL